MQEALHMENRDKVVKTTLGNLAISREAFNRLVAQPMSVAESFKLLKMLKTVNVELDQYEEARKKLFEKYGEVVEQIGPQIKYQIKPEHQIDLEREHSELVAIEVVVPGEQIHASTLNGIQISAADLLALSWLIKE